MTDLIGRLPATVYRALPDWLFVRTTDGEKRNDFPFLDGLRAFAALLVFCGHAMRSGIMGFGGTKPVWLDKEGVYLFFVLSAFLLARPVASKGTAFVTRPNLSRYFARRIFRVYPLYIVFLTFAFTGSLLADLSGVKGLAVPFHIGAAEFYGHLALRLGYSVTWSIAVEFKYYFLLPLAALLLTMAVQRSWFVGLAAAVSAILLITFIFPSSHMHPEDLRLGYYLPLFIAGTFLGVLSVAYHDQLTTLPAVRHAASAAAVLGLAGLCFITPASLSLLLGRPVSEEEQRSFVLLFALLWSITLFGLLYGHDLLRRPFEHPIVRYLGTISFSFYLWHLVSLVIYQRFMTRIGGPIFSDFGWIPVMAGTLVIAHFTYVLIERPFLSINPAKLKLGRAPLVIN